MVADDGNAGSSSNPRFVEFRLLRDGADYANPIGRLPDGDDAIAWDSTTPELYVWTAESDSIERVNVESGGRTPIFHRSRHDEVSIERAGRGWNSVLNLKRGVLATRGREDATENVSIIRIEDNKRILEFDFASIGDIAFSPDGDTFACGGSEGVILWHADGDIWTKGPVLQDVPQFVGTLAFDQSGKLLAMTTLQQQTRVYDIGTGRAIHEHPEENRGTFRPMALDSNHRVLATADNAVIRLFDIDGGSLLSVLEGHTDKIHELAFCDAGRLLVSQDRAELRVWDVGSGTFLASATIEDSALVHTSLPLLATFHTNADESLIGPRTHTMMWRVSADNLLSSEDISGVTYTTAKVVLVGDSGVGKTGLGWRLAHGEFREHSSTHGQQFWLLNQLGTQRSDGTACEAILWDLAGQPDYRLIHALFLDDADVALIVFDPTRDKDPLGGVEYWIKQLPLHRGLVGGGDSNRIGRCTAILVAARTDRGVGRLSLSEIEDFRVREGLDGFVNTSALTGHGVPGLVEMLQEAVDWDARPKIVTTTTFKRVKDHVLRLKEARIGERIIVTPTELQVRLEAEYPEEKVSEAELLTSIGHLANHGYVALLKTSQGENRVLLASELLNNVAASIVLEARGNPLGLGSIEERALLAGEYRFAELAELSDDDRGVLLDSAVAMFLAHNMCFRQTDPLGSRVFLVFPELINLKKPAEQGMRLDYGAIYSVGGATQNVYASLVVLLGYTSTFTRANQWRDEARYVVGDGLICGFRLESESDSGLSIVLYFGPDVGTPIRTLFRSLVESFLYRRDVTVTRFDPVRCAAGHQLNASIVREQIAEGGDAIFCSRCGRRVSLDGVSSTLELGRNVTGDLTTQQNAAADRSLFEQALFQIQAYVNKAGLEPPSCFISYAWGDATHERWVERDLAADLTKAGVDVILDKWENARVGASIHRFVDRMERADYVLVIGTTLYRMKYENQADSGSFVVGAEGDLIGKRLTGSEVAKESVLPALLEGSETVSLPPLLQGRVFVDFRESGDYFKACLSLITTIYRIPPTSALARQLATLLASD